MDALYQLNKYEREQAQNFQATSSSVQGCCHGELDAIYNAIEERQGEDKIDLLLICGDFQSIRNEADLETISCPRKYLNLGTFHKYYSGECEVPVPTVFIGGNHESSNYLWELYHGGWVCPGIYFLGFGGVINVGGLRIGGMSGIFKSGHYETGHYEVTPYNDNHKRSVYHIRNYDVYKMLQVKEPLDVFMSHDWPRGIEQYGNTRMLLRSKKHFIQEVKSNTLGSPAFEKVLIALRPTQWFSAHLHCRFTAQVYWNEDRPQQGELLQVGSQMPLEQPQQPTGGQTSSGNPDAINFELSDSEGDANAKPTTATTSQVVKNPDEIDIALDDDDDDVVVAKPTTTTTSQVVKNPDEIDITLDDDDDEGQVQDTKEEKKEMAAPASNPDEIQIGMDDEGEEESEETSKGQQQQQSSTSSSASTRQRASCTKFLALDKCLPKRNFLEFIDLPDVQGPVEFKYDEEWLSIVRTLDAFLSLEHKQKKPLEGDRLKQALAVNREWVRENITKKQGLAIPENFRPTAPAHDPVRTMGHQEKQEAIMPFLNPQTVDFCSMLQIPNKINPYGRRPAST
ncbi:lariat debranching enzyme [Mortierella sp. GBA43]|nr:lariat debranching enzyme [Mortierella sp. GBA43]